MVSSSQSLGILFTGFYNRRGSKQPAVIVVEKKNDGPTLSQSHGEQVDSQASGSDARSALVTENVQPIPTKPVIPKTRKSLIEQIQRHIQSNPPTSSGTKRVSEAVQHRSESTGSSKASARALERKSSGMALNPGAPEFIPPSRDSSFGASLSKSGSSECLSTPSSIASQVCSIEQLAAYYLTTMKPYRPTLDNPFSAGSHGLAFRSSDNQSESDTRIGSPDGRGVLASWYSNA